MKSLVKYIYESISLGSVTSGNFEKADMVKSAIKNYLEYDKTAKPFWLIDNNRHYEKFVKDIDKIVSDVNNNQKISRINGEKITDSDIDDYENVKGICILYNANDVDNKYLEKIIKFVSKNVEYKLILLSETVDKDKENIFKLTSPYTVKIQ